MWCNLMSINPNAEVENYQGIRFDLHAPPPGCQLDSDTLGFNTPQLARSSVAFYIVLTTPY
jgi:hypothetical protein